MRRPAKPFAVEVRKSKKPSDRDILGRSAAAVAPAPEAPARQDHQLDIDRVFARFAPAAPAAPPSEARLTAEAVFSEIRNTPPVPPPTPAVRILPDLSVAPAPAVVEAPARAKRQAEPKLPRPKKKASPVPRKAKEPAPLPVPINGTKVAIPVRAAAAKVAAEPQKRVVVRRRVRDDAEVGLRPGERWKRRLPRALR